MRGASAVGRCFITSSWQEAQLRWKASWWVSVTVAALASCLMDGVSGSVAGFAPARTWQERQAMMPMLDGPSSYSSAVSVVVRSAGQAARVPAPCFFGVLPLLSASF